MVFTASLRGSQGSYKTQMCLGLPIFWGHLSLEYPKKMAPVSLLCGASRPTSNGSINFQERQVWGWVRKMLSSSQGPCEGGSQPCGQTTLLLSGSGCCLIHSLTIPPLPVAPSAAFLYPDNSSLIPDCSVLQTSLTLWEKWEVITPQVEKALKFHSDVLVHRTLLSTFHHRKFLIHLLPYCRRLLVVYMVSIIPYFDLWWPSTSVSWA